VSSFSAESLRRRQTLHAFQEQSSRRQRLEVVGDLLVLQLKQLPGCSTNAAQAIADRFGGTLFNLHNSLSSTASTAAVVPSLPSLSLPPLF
jgi:hypothetical protein